METRVRIINLLFYFVIYFIVCYFIMLIFLFILQPSVRAYSKFLYINPYFQFKILKDRTINSLV